MKVSTRWACIALLVFATIVLFQVATHTPLSHDEESYIFPAVIAESATAYEDFVYLQPPNHLLLFSTVFRFIDEHYFYAARLIVFVLSLFALLTIVWLAKRATSSVFVALVAGGMFLSSQIMIRAFGLARNDMMAGLFAMLGVAAFYYLLTSERRRAIAGFLSGLFMGIAVGTKVTYVFVPVLVVSYGIYVAQSRRFSFSYQLLVSVLIGGVVAAIPLLYFFGNSPENFVYGVYSHHLFSSQLWAEQNAIPFVDTLSGKVTDLFRYSARDEVVLASGMLIALAGLYGLFSRTWHQIHERLRSGHAYLFLVLFLGAIPFVVAPRPSHLQYFQPMVPFLILVACFALALLRDKLSMRLFAPVFVAVLIALIPGAKTLLARVSLPDQVTIVDSVSAEIADALEAQGTQPVVVTFSPVRVANVGIEVPVEFSTGPFFYRSAGQLDTAQVTALNGVSESTLEETLDAIRPDGILVGFESVIRVRLDAGLRAYAAEHGYTAHDIGGGQATLFVKE